MKNRLLLLTILVIFNSTVVNGQRKPAKADPIKSARKRVSVSFDDELVKGASLMPEGDLIQNRMDNRFKRFIKIRKDFIQDVENTKDEFGNR